MLEEVSTRDTLKALSTVKGLKRLETLVNRNTDNLIKQLKRNKH